MMRFSLYFHRVFIAIIFILAFLHGAVAEGRADEQRQKDAENVLALPLEQLAEVVI